ncbi:unnamed protein product [Caenorhabditis sp. 36 PRJEB53466]|nr:unnamed protein product [Caenorhabditis sp. 36 PRJEB53466]
MDDATSSSILCQICNVPAHGVHFGVPACRACAAFFRRTIVRNSQTKYKCRGFGNDCNVNSEGRYHCRLCRFNKCISLGMTTENVQWDRDPHIITLLTTDQKKRRDSDHPNDPKPFNPLLKPKRIVDVSKVALEIKKSLVEGNEYQNTKMYRSLNKLEQAEFALKEWRTQQKPESEMQVCRYSMIFPLRTFSRRKQRNGRNLEMADALLRLSISEFGAEISVLPISLELLEEVRKNDMKFAISTEHLMTKKSTINFSKVSDYPREKLKMMFQDSMMGFYQQVARPLLELKLSTIEVAYILCEICWQVAGKNLQGKVLETSERVRDELADDLHKYYQTTQSSQNYAARLIKLMKVVGILLNTHLDRTRHRDTEKRTRHFGGARKGETRKGETARRPRKGETRKGETARRPRKGETRKGETETEPRHGETRKGETRKGETARRPRKGETRKGETETEPRHGETRKGETARRPRHGETRLDETARRPRHGETRLDETETEPRKGETEMIMERDETETRKNRDDTRARHRDFSHFCETSLDETTH